MIDASVSKKRKTKQHLKYDQLCHEQRQAACEQEAVGSLRAKAKGKCSA
jgi:hypothetical protein